MRPVIKGSHPLDDKANPIVFTDYAYARRYLIERIGEYCSYCERKVVANLAVEHVQPKDLNPQLALVWDNFLLACTNCNSTKGKKPVELSEYFWPDKCNTFPLYNYEKSGMVNVAAGITDPDTRSKIQAMLDLVGLQSIPPSIGTKDWEKASDRRFQHRIEAWISASDYEQKYDLADTSLKSQLVSLLVIVATHTGLWSIWMKIFEAYPEVTDALILAFPGTNPIVKNQPS